ncbi:MAG: type III secretion system chaperone [Methylocystis sp.]|uniref:type III secretion system chaperone n=1 Tax=Methylocystis sp. TaxID=1911079 RepID=UPI003DA300F7
MSIEMALRNLLAEIGQHFSFGELRLDEERGCALRFGGRTTVNLQYRDEDDAFYLYAILGAPPPRLETYRDLLGANLFWEGTSGATLSLSNDDPPRVVLSQAFDWRGKTGAQFARTIETFAAVVGDWAEMLSGESDRGQATAAPLNAEMAAMIRV